MCDVVMSDIQPSSDEELDEEKRKIVCYDSRLLTDVCQHVVREVESFVNERMSAELAKKFTARFEELYEAVVKENVSIRELSMGTYSQQTSSEKRKSKSKIVNENLLPKLGELLVELLEKRKSYPYHCCQILHQKFKHDRKSLKIPPQYNLIDVKHDFLWNEENNEVKYVKHKLDLGFQQLNNFIMQVENAISKVKKLEEDAHLAKAIFQKEKQNILGIFCETNKNSNNDKHKSTEKFCMPPAVFLRKNDDYFPRASQLR